MSEFKSIKVQILVPFAIILVLLVFISWYQFYSFQKNTIDNSVKTTLDHVEELFQGELKKSSKVFQGLLDFIKKDKELQSAFINKDHKLLFKLSTPIFNEIKNKYGVTHWYFHNLNKVNFIRVHSPNRNGDLIKRWTLNNTVEKKQLSQGIELSHFGRFALRVVIPWFVDDKLIGYMELGQEIEHITQDLKEFTRGELLFAIQKTLLRKDEWEDGLKMMGKIDDWNQFNNFVISDRTINSFPIGLKNKTIAEAINQEKEFTTIEAEDMIWKGGVVNLFDVSGSKVGNILFIKNVTEQVQQMRRWQAIALTASAIGLFFLIYIIYSHIRKIDKKLERSNKELSSFASITSHDLKTPIRKISNFCSFIEEDEPQLSNKTKEYLSKIELTSNHALELIEGILNYSKLGEDKTSHTQINLNEVLTQVIEYLEIDIKEAKASVTFNKLPNVLGNRIQIEQLFENLISNSIKYRNEEKSTLIEVKHAESIGESIQIIVKDNGKGFDSKYADKIFDPFQRLDGTISKIGSGLGLSICKKIMLAHNGDIIAEGEIGAGAKFIILFRK